MSLPHRFFGFKALLTAEDICFKCYLYLRFILGFPTGRDIATFRDNGTEVSSLSRDKGTTGQAQNLATGRDGTGFQTGCPVPGRPGTKGLAKKFQKNSKIVKKNPFFPSVP